MGCLPPRTSLTSRDASVRRLWLIRVADFARQMSSEGVLLPLQISLDLLSFPLVHTLRVLCFALARFLFAFVLAFPLLSFSFVGFSCPFVLVFPLFVCFFSRLDFGVTSMFAVFYPGFMGSPGRKVMRWSPA